MTQPDSESSRIHEADAAPLPGARLATGLLGLSIFATGFCGLVSEFILSTVSSYILGNSVEQFSIVIALMMAMMGLAGALQHFFSGRYLVEQFIVVEMLLALLGGFAPIAIYAAYGALDTHFPLVLYAVVMAIGFLIGFELPLVLRINAAYVKRLPSNLAVILSLDYIGGFIGAIVWTRWLLRELPLTESSFVVAGGNFAIASVTYLYFSWHQHAVDQPVDRQNRHEWRVRPVATAGIVVIGAALMLGFVRNRDWSFDLEQRLYDEPVVYSETTRYQRIVLTYEAARDDYRLFSNGNLQFSSADEAVYHEQLVHPAMQLAARRERVLILGGGDGLALREVLKYPDVASVTLVDIDPRMTELAATLPALVELNGRAFADARVRRLRAGGVTTLGSRPVFMELEEDGDQAAGAVDEVARVEVVNVDADRFVSSIPGRYDVVVIDLPDPNSVELAKLYSREFYRKLARVVERDGIVALQATSPYHAREAFLCILRTVKSAGYTVLPYHDDVPSFGSWGWILADRSGAAGDVLRARAQGVGEIPVATRYLTPEVFRAALVFGRDRLQSQHAGVNTLMQPMLLDLYLRESWLAD